MRKYEVNIAWHLIDSLCWHCDGHPFRYLNVCVCVCVLFHDLASLNSGACGG